MDQRYGTEVWNRGMMRYGTDPSRRYGTGYGTGVWNGCGPGACSGPPILTCPHLFLQGNSIHGRMSMVSLVILSSREVARAVRRWEQ